MTPLAQATDLLTNSRLKTFRQCPRLHQLRYVEGYRPSVEAAALHFGTLMHLALEAWWTAPDDSQRLTLALEALESEADPYDRAKAQALMNGYDARWLNEPYEVIAVEVSFAAPLVHPRSGVTSPAFRQGGKIDGIALDTRTNRKLLVEHKTSSEDLSAGSSYWQNLRLDSQISIYFEGARSLGHDVDGCLYDVIGKPTIKPAKATPTESRKYTKDGKLYANQRDRDETPEEYRARLMEDIAANPNDYYQRQEVVRIGDELAEAAEDVWTTGALIQLSLASGRAPRNPDNCHRIGRGACSFFEVCTGAESLHDSPRFVRDGTVHPELAV